MFNERLKEAIISRGMNQRKFAMDFGVSEQTLSKWIRGERCPHIDVVVQICDYFDVSADWLLGR